MPVQRHPRDHAGDAAVLGLDRLGQPAHAHPRRPARGRLVGHRREAGGEAQVELDGARPVALVRDPHGEDRERAGGGLARVDRDVGARGRGDGEDGGGRRERDDGRGTTHGWNAPWVRRDGRCGQPATAAGGPRGAAAPRSRSETSCRARDSPRGCAERRRRTAGPAAGGDPLRADVAAAEQQREQHERRRHEQREVDGLHAHRRLPDVLDERRHVARAAFEVERGDRGAHHAAAVALHDLRVGHEDRAAQVGGGGAHGAAVLERHPRSGDPAHRGPGRDAALADRVAARAAVAREQLLARLRRRVARGRLLGHGGLLLAAAAAGEREGDGGEHAARHPPRRPCAQADALRVARRAVSRAPAAVASPSAPTASAMAASRPVAVAVAGGGRGRRRRLLPPRRSRHPRRRARPRRRRPPPRRRRPA